MPKNAKRVLIRGRRTRKLTAPRCDETVYINPYTIYVSWYSGHPLVAYGSRHGPTVPDNLRQAVNIWIDTFCNTMTLKEFLHSTIGVSLD